MSASNTAMPLTTTSATSLGNCPNLPKTLMMSRAESTPAPVTSASCHATCSSTMRAGCCALRAH
eukprot:14163310-Alexandrium_andersonii.AAC.1